MADVKRVRLRLPGGGRATVEARPEQSILDAALAAGVTLPHSCCQGWCLTCAARLQQGEVVHRAARRYYPQDRAAGFILPCVAAPLTDCVIQTHAQREMIAFRRQQGLPTPPG